MIRSLLLWFTVSFAAPQQEDDPVDLIANLVSYQELSPSARVAFIPELTRRHPGMCVFALVLETDKGDVRLTTLDVAYDGDDMRHEIPLSQRFFPKTAGNATWYVMTLRSDLAIIKTTSYGKSGRVVMNRTPEGVCSFSRF